MANNEAKIHNTFAKALNQLENLRSVFRSSGQFAQAVTAIGGDTNYLQDIDAAFSSLLEVMYDAEYGMSAHMSGAEDQEESVQEGDLNEISRKTKDSYIAKADDDYSKAERRYAKGVYRNGGKHYNDPDTPEMEKDAHRMKKRYKGLGMAYNDVEEANQCNMTMEGEHCPVHGMNECSGYIPESNELSSLKVLAGL